jgi:hypothetical protein
MDKHGDRQSECLSAEERQYVVAEIPNSVIKMFLALNNQTGKQFACDECVLFLQTLMRSRTIVHELN